MTGKAAVIFLILAIGLSTVKLASAHTSSRWRSNSSHHSSWNSYRSNQNSTSSPSPYPVLTPTPTPTTSYEPVPSATPQPTPQIVTSPQPNSYPATSATPLPTSLPTPAPTNTPVIGGPNSGFGTGSNQGLETGINLTVVNQVKADIAQGVYDRSCAAAEHNPTQWHSLVNIEAKCHYDHHHGDDPNYVNDIFGQPGEWFGSPGQSVSYPWQTFVIPAGQGPTYVNTDPAQQENVYKHEGYAWAVRRNQDCPTRQPDNSGNPFVRPMGACITDFRVQYHFHGLMDVSQRYHSTSAEMRVCLDKDDPSTCGIYRTGGWMDMGRLFTTSGTIACNHGVGETFIPIPGETAIAPFNRVEARDEIRCHPNITDLTGLPDQSTATAEWWGLIPNRTAELRFQLSVYDIMGNIDSTNPTNYTLFCNPGDAGCAFTNSMASMFVGYTEHFWSGNITGTKVYYINRWGENAANCTTANVDCIPLTLENVKMNLDYNGDGTAEEARYFHTRCDECEVMNHNLSPVGQQWITWFYR